MAQGVPHLHGNGVVQTTLDVVDMVEKKPTECVFSALILERYGIDSMPPIVGANLLSLGAFLMLNTADAA